MVMDMPVNTLGLVRVTTCGGAEAVPTSASTNVTLAGETTGWVTGTSTTGLSE